MEEIFLRVISHDVDYVRQYLENGGNPNPKCSKFAGLLHYTLYHNDIAKMLIDAGTDIESRDCNKNTILHGAIIAENPYLVKLLVDAGADVHALDIARNTPLHNVLYVNSKHTRRSLFELLSERTDNLDTTNIDGLVPLHTAVHLGLTYEVQLLLEHGADITVVTTDQKDPLEIAIQNKFPKIVKLLLEHGAEVNPINAECVPLDRAIEMYDHDVIEILLEHGANPNRVDHMMNTPLHNIISMCHYNVEKTVKLLLSPKYNVNVDARNKNGDTPLHFAVKFARFNLIWMLLEHCPDLTIKNNMGYNPMMVAENKNYFGIVEILQDYIDAVPMVKGVIDTI